MGDDSVVGVLVAAVVLVVVFDVLHDLTVSSPPLRTCRLVVITVFVLHFVAFPPLQERQYPQHNLHQKSVVWNLQGFIWLIAISTL